MKIIKLSEEKLKRKKMQESSAELHEVLPVLKLFKDKKTENKEIKTVSEQSQDEWVANMDSTFTDTLDAIVF